jgi:hypothetical protein
VLSISLSLLRLDLYRAQSQAVVLIHRIIVVNRCAALHLGVIDFDRRKLLNMTLDVLLDRTLLLAVEGGLFRHVCLGNLRLGCFEL